MREAAGGPALAQGIDLALRGLEHDVGLARPLEHHAAISSASEARERMSALSRTMAAYLSTFAAVGVTSMSSATYCWESSRMTPAHAHLVEHGHGVYGLAVREHGEYGLKYVAVGVDVKILGRAACL